MKIRAQVMLDNDLFTLLVGLQQRQHVKNLSVVINKIIREALTYQKQLENKDAIIDNLHKTITKIGTEKESYLEKYSLYKKKYEEVLKNEQKNISKPRKKK